MTGTPPEMIGQHDPFPSQFSHSVLQSLFVVGSRLFGSVMHELKLQTLKVVVHECARNNSSDTNVRKAEREGTENAMVGRRRRERAREMREENAERG